MRLITSHLTLKRFVFTDNSNIPRSSVPIRRQPWENVNIITIPKATFWWGRNYAVSHLNIIEPKRQNCIFYHSG